MLSEIDNSVALSVVVVPETVKLPSIVRLPPTRTSSPVNSFLAIPTPPENVTGAETLEIASVVSVNAVPAPLIVGEVRVLLVNV